VVKTGGLLWGKSFLKSLLGPMFAMSDQGWRKAPLALTDGRWPSREKQIDFTRQSAPGRKIVN